ncbi:hypothetical protein [Neptuniibacter sp. QD37_11]|uniref:hypothetical protein n=1 Tax=Neptuniibacter sp. QD37_11 TaxID=3398209 RepID=UPI0039F4D7D6
MSNLDVSRKEDMSPRGQLNIFRSDDGDIHVTVYQDDGNGGVGAGSSVEFCSPLGGGGGKSPRTMKALIELARAIELDNAEAPERAGDL